MKKIKMNHSNSDRIICVTTEGQHNFYYQPAKSKDRFWLVKCNFSGSIFTYFRDKGRNMDGAGYSVTIREFYNFRHENEKLGRLMDRLPDLINFVIKEHLNNAAVQTVPVIKYPNEHMPSNIHEDEIAA